MTRRFLLASDDFRLRRARLSALLAEATPSVFVPELERILESAERRALTDLSEVLGDPALRARVVAGAEEMGSRVLSQWLSGVVMRSRVGEPNLRDEHGRLLTLGEKKSLARAVGASALPRLLADVEPEVVARALGHPRLTEETLVRVVGKRPGLPVLLTEIARHAKWVRNARIRAMVVGHPDTPPASALLLVPLLLRQDLLLLVSQPRVPVQVREACAARLRTASS